MAVRKRKIDKRGSGVEHIFAKADARKESGCDPIMADWQATLELYFFMIREHLLVNQGQLLPGQIDGQDQWDFYLEILAKLDLPPDTCALLMTPSAFKSLHFTEFLGLDRVGLEPWKENTYSILISDCVDHQKIMHVALPGRETVGMDVLENGNHLAGLQLLHDQRMLRRVVRSYLDIFWPGPAMG